METFQRDTEYIIRQAGLETLLLNKVPKAKEQKISNRSHKNDTIASIPKWVVTVTRRLRFEICLSRYFSQIDEELLRQILEIYQLDFDLFDYDSSKYHQLVKKSKKIDVNNRLDFDGGEKELNAFS